MFLSHLYRSRLVTVAAIRGSCPAGGCITSLCCDWRVMSADGNPIIGLNEVALGISVPRHWAAVMATTVGHRHAERLLSRGQLVGAAEAKELGLVDDVVDKAGLMEAAEREMRVRLRHADTGRVLTKTAMREALSMEWERTWQAEAESGWAMLSEEKTVRMMSQVLQRLSGGKKQTGKGEGTAGSKAATAATSSAHGQVKEQHTAKL